MHEYTLMASWTCSGCDKTSAVPQQHGTDAQALAKRCVEIAREQGWHIPGGRHRLPLCPDCQQAGHLWRRDVSERLSARASVRPDGCHLYSGQLTRTGYGVFKIGRKNFAAHRVAYEQWVGPIPPGLDIDHLCNVRNCINPAHLEPVTHAENLRRARERRSA